MTAVLLLGLLLATTDTSPVVTVETFHRTLAAGDREAALALLAPDLIVFESGHAELSREQYAAEHLAIDIEFSRTTERLVGDRRYEVDGDHAWVLTRAAVEGTFRDTPIDSTLDETMILRRDGDEWRIIHIHWSSTSHLEATSDDQ